MMLASPTRTSIALWACFVLPFFILVACGPAGEDDLPSALPDNFTNYSNPNLGIQFSYPQDWILREGLGGLEITSNQSILDTGSITADTQGMLVNIGVGRLETNLNATTTEIINQILASSGAEGNAEISEPVSETTINGQPAATMTLQSEFSGMALTLRLVVIRNEERVVVVTAAFPSDQEAQFATTLDTLTRSIQLIPTRAGPGEEQNS